MLDGYSEGIALDPVGQVSEGSGQNLFLVRDEVLYTPPIGASVLPGITRDSVITLAQDLGLDVREQDTPARDALRRRRDVLHGHGGRSHADPIGRQDPSRRRPARPDYAALQQAFFDYINGAARTRTAG